MSRRIAWYCANRECGTVLGNILEDELILDLENIKTANTSRTALVVTCNNCMREKVFFPTLESNIFGAISSFKRELYLGINRP